MEFHLDFRDLLELLRKYDVEYAIADGNALAFHGAPRYTSGLDVLIAANTENAARVVAALGEFGFAQSGLSVSDFERPGYFVRLGHPPVRVDILTSISGVSWDEVSGNLANGVYGDVPVTFIGRDQFIANKRAAGRQKDLADIEALGEDE